MIAVDERSMSELTDAELDAVCGGIFNLGNLGNIITQNNTAVQVGLSFGGGFNSVAQLISQANYSF
jgi:hypothetical protein